jgi:hypothetical protein
MILFSTHGYEREIISNKIIICAVSCGPKRVAGKCGGGEFCAARMHGDHSGPTKARASLPPSSTRPRYNLSKK